jgi:hypothetical protein
MPRRFLHRGFTRSGVFLAYINLPLNHFKYIQTWVQTNNADAQLDFKTFELEIKVRNRYFRLLPQFIARLDGRLVHVPHLTKEVHGFIGWLPYRPVRWAMSSDKLVFKRFLDSAGMATPAYAVGAATAKHDFLLKRSIGSFGYELYGPYRYGTTAPAPASGHMDRGELYAEQFIKGRNLKVWFWGASAIYAHLQTYPVITGDGRSSVSALVASRLAQAGQSSADAREMTTMRSSLAFQHVPMEHVLPEGSMAWLDYRYGRLYQSAAPTIITDNDLAALDAAALGQLAHIASSVALELKKEFPAPVLYSLDAVLDDAGKIWWLEMNSNPILPPDGYPVILDSLFAIPKQQPADGQPQQSPQATPLLQGQPEHAH